MKTFLWILLIVGLVLIFGTWPISVLGKVFEWLAWLLNKIAGILDWFDWNGVLAQIGIAG